MTKMCKKILKVLRKSDNHTLLYWDRDEILFPDEAEFFDAVRYLASKGLVEFVTVKNGNHIGIHASHISMHPLKLMPHPVLHWIFHEYIGGIVIGITATLVSELLIYLLSEPVRKWFSQLFLQ